MNGRRFGLIGVVSLVLACGCSGDMTKMLTTNTQMRDQIMTAIAGNGGLTASMMDKLLGSDSTRTMVTDKLMSNAPAMREMMVKIAGNQSMVDGILNLAVQDSSMREHVTTLLKGIQMGSATP